MSCFRSGFAALLLLSCIQGQGSDTVFIDNSFTFPGVSLPAGVPIPEQTESQSVPIDVSSDLNKLSQYGNPSLSIVSDQVSGDVSFVSNLTIALACPGFPNVAVANFSPNQSSKVNQVPVLLSGDELLTYLSSGPCSLNFSITGTPPSQSISLENNLVLSASESINKTL